jgi:heme-degrading monooxygenase HmoA
MNQVTEMLRLAPGASVEDAVARLAGLFEMMRGEPGFCSAEVLRRLDEPSVLLVLHAWERLEDWQAFQTSPPKLDFSASRPASLYTFVPCGMNWRLEAGGLDGAGAFLRREVLRGEAAPRSGAEVTSSATNAFEGSEADHAGTALRLSRLRSVPAAHDAVEGVVADELYESLLQVSAAATKAAAARGR